VRDAEVDHVEPVVEVLPKSAFSHHALEVGYVWDAKSTTGTTNPNTRRRNPR